MKKIFLILLIILTSCSSDNSDDNNSNSVPIFITKSEITLTGENNNNSLSQVSFCYDKDSFQGTTYSGQCTQGQSIPYSSTYIGSLKFYNGNENSFIDVTQEILNNSDDYLVVFHSFSDDGGYTYEYLSEFDTNSNPLGINFRLYVTPNNLGLCPKIDVYLAYAPNMDKANVPMTGASLEVHQQFLTDIRNNQGGEIVASVHNWLSCD